MREVINFGQFKFEEAVNLVRQITDPRIYYLVCEKLVVGPSNQELYEQGKRMTQTRGEPDVLIIPPYRRPIMHVAPEVGSKMSAREELGYNEESLSRPTPETKAKTQRLLRGGRA